MRCALAGLALSLPGVAAAQEPASAAPRPREAKNLVVVTLDTLRADRLRCYGYFRDTMPHLDAVAAQALRFTNCRTPIAQTAPSHVSIFTGVGPYEHGVLTNRAVASKQGLKTSATLRTLAEVLRAGGMKTGGFVSAVPVKRQLGLDAGFDLWGEPTAKRRQGGDVIAEALKFIEGCGENPFFAWVHLYDAHEPLEPPFTPKKYLTLFADDEGIDSWIAGRGFPIGTIRRGKREYEISECNNEYDGALRFLDDQLEVLLARLRRPDLGETTALVLVSDHGTALGQHQHVGHGTCWDEQLRIPLLIRVPGVEPRVIDASMSSLDLWPTLAGLVPSLIDPAFLAQCRGADVLADDFEPRPAFALAATEQRLVALTAGRWKLLKPTVGSARLYDHESDPYELTDVAASHPDVVARLEALLEDEIARQHRGRALHRKDATESETVDPEIARQLRELGYVDESAPPAEADDEEIVVDPEDEHEDDDARR